MANIFIVDDEPNIVCLLRFVLEAAGHHVDSAGNGREALELLGVGTGAGRVALPDIILSDVNMPELDGYGTVMRLAADPRTSAIPVLVLTTKGQLRDVFRECANVKDFLEKPFLPKTLMALLEKTLSGCAAGSAR